MRALRDDIENLADALFRNGYPVHRDIESWVVRTNNAVNLYKVD